ncbi:3-hydroxybutyryl-CoA dehydrogenase [Echinicola pacifica]|uniref:3-hydroxybutyryl-CoA dehydrogenase n=1 Tax=Echinicola pacifica TaxID=346377 RepID=A0A918Q4Q8_9BACT|nr:3-hydroxyacyl-CoA dehydrogenase NAD-binding domain-containing protein [Echinicola pacifica]GGZ32011.1 3-hydroxybutyryl-CoA dehydrogenase [Echinicola pacifica]
MKNITVIGSGTMGNGIAHVLAQYNFSVSLYDINEAALEKALLTIGKNLDRQIDKGKLPSSQKQSILGKIQTYTSLEESLKTADMVIEATTENEELKLNLFRQMDQACPAHCLLATNTSSISITKIASVTSRPGKVIGMHFMNPVPIMPLVEVISGYGTTKDTLSTVMSLAKNLGKSPVMVNDYPGFIANRILMPMINEAIYSLYEGVAGVEEIDQVMKMGMAHPMGPLQLADFIGLDVCLFILKVMQSGFGNPKYAPCPLLVNMVAAGSTGAKAGEGFYTYSPNSKELIVSPRFRRQ